MKKLDKRVFAVSGMVLRAAILLSGYVFFAYNHAQGHVCAHTAQFIGLSLIYAILSLMWIFKDACRNVYQKKIHANWPRYCLYALVPIAAFYIIEMCYNPNWRSIRLIKAVINCLMIGCIYVGLILILGNGLRAGKVSLWAAWIFGLANFYVLQFKGHPLMSAEILAWQTALSVAGNYSYWMTDALAEATLLFLFMLCLVSIMPGAKRSEKPLWKKLVLKRACLAVAGVVWLWASYAVLFIIPWTDIRFINVNETNMDANNLWGWSTMDGLYSRNGVTFSFLMQIQMSQVKPPETYSKADAQELLTENDEKKALDVQPTVIVIMNESFSDLKALGDFESDDYMANWYQMDDYVLRGTAYASTVSNGTHRSEFEFLTGNSARNLPVGVIPYMMYSMEGVENMASTLKEYGYETVAFHPHYASNWNRKHVYAAMGFDLFLSRESFPQMDMLREKATDRFCYDQIISLYENRTEPLFVFNVTMQNHSGYEGLDTVASLSPVYLAPEYRQYESAETYLTLIKESDAAFKDLLDYFRQADEPVILCLFGDHQPGLSDGFLDEIWDASDMSIANQEKRYAVPYVIWANYDVGVSGIEKDTSLNYLGAELLQLIGVTTPYTQMLLDMEREIPVVNQYGYQTTDGVWHSPEDENDWLRQYENLQYYQMFDK